MLCSDIELLTPETSVPFSFSKSTMSPLSVLYQSWSNKMSLIFLPNSIVPDLFKRALLSVKSTLNRKALLLENECQLKRDMDRK